MDFVERTPRPVVDFPGHERCSVERLGPRVIARGTGERDRRIGLRVELGHPGSERGLLRGVTHDTEFEKWANKVWNFGSGLGSEVSLKDFRKDLIIEMYNEAGQLAIAYKVFRCWVSEFQALPDLDANANAVAIAHIKLENEGWERDTDVTEPAEPTFTEPAG